MSRSFLALSRLLIGNYLYTINPFRLRGRNSDRAGVIRKGLYTLLILFAYLSLGVLLVGMEFGLYKAAEALHQPQLLLGLVLLMAFISTLLMGFFHATSMLYDGKEIPYLAPLPVTSWQIYAVRTLILYIGELIWNALLLIPGMLFYAWMTGGGVMYWIRAAVIVLTAPLLPLAIIMTLSGLLMRLQGFVKHRRTLIMVLTIALALTYSVGVQYLSQRMSRDFQDLSVLLGFLTGRIDLMNRLIAGVPHLRWAVVGLQGQWLMLFAFALLGIAAMALVQLIFSRSFQRVVMEIDQGGEATVSHKHEKVLWTQRGTVLALHDLEWKKLLRTPAWLFNGLAGMAIMPLAYGAALYFNLKNNDVNLSELLTGQFDTGWVTLIAFALLSFVAMVNPAASTSTSREGEGYAFALSLPVAVRQRLLSKILVGFEISFGTLTLLAVPLMLVLGSAWALPLAIAYAMGIVYSLIVTSFNVYLDALRPMLKWSNETLVMKQNSNTGFGMLIWLGSLIPMALAVWLLFDRGPTVIVAVLACILALELAVAIFAMKPICRKCGYLPEN